MVQNELLPLYLHYCVDGLSGPKYNTRDNMYSITFTQTADGSTWTGTISHGYANVKKEGATGELKKPWQLIIIEIPPPSSRYYATFSRYLHQTGFAI